MTPNTSVLQSCNFVQGFIVIASFLIPCCEAGITEKHAAGNCHCFIVVLVVSPVCFFLFYTFLSYTFTFNTAFFSEAQLNLPRVDASPFTCDTRVLTPYKASIVNIPLLAEATLSCS